MRRSLLCLGILCLIAMLSGGALNLALAQEKGKASDQRAAQESSLPDKHIAVFLVGFAGSDTVSALDVDQQATVVHITNVGKTTSCPVAVAWRFDFGNTVCTTTSDIPGGTPVGDSRDHCTRLLPVAIVECDIVCSPPLTFYEGKAVVSTTPECAREIAVDARLYHTTGPHDQVVAGIADLKVIRLPDGNQGD